MGEKFSLSARKYEIIAACRQWPESNITLVTAVKRQANIPHGANYSQVGKYCRKNVAFYTGVVSNVYREVPFPVPERK